MSDKKYTLNLSLLMPALLLLGMGAAVMLFTGCSRNQGDGAGDSTLLDTAVASFNGCSKESKSSADDFVTVVGTDSNKNGIRDDVDIAIQKKYPDDGPQRRAVDQFARASQLIVVFGFCSSDDIRDSSIQAYDNIIFELRGATGCLVTRFKDNAETKKVLDFFDDVVFNTPARRKALDFFEKSQINQVPRVTPEEPLQIRTPCEDQR